MKRQLNFELIQFHVHEAACELSSLVALLKDAQGKQLSESEKIFAAPYRKQKLTENLIKVLLEHVYHHLNFAWNVRKKEWEDADRHFSRDERFPKDFVRFWPKSKLKRKVKGAES
jgi:hypothetical protein